ncbi:MAG: hypothetical protein J0H74_26350 [Chitinophagaceae bacterium]|nr:hypothetical protein [Chitinophagaceae bacterium]
MEKRAARLLKNLEILPELGRQRCFELGNPFYYQDAADAKEPGNESGDYWRKELPSGELFLVTLQVDEIKGENYSVKDTIIRQIK